MVVIDAQQCIEHVMQVRRNANHILYSPIYHGPIRSTSFSRAEIVECCGGETTASTAGQK